MGQLSSLVLVVTIEEQRRGVLLQLPDRSVRPVERLGSLERRPATSSRDERDGQFADGARNDRLGAHQPWVSTERDATGVLGAAIQHHGLTIVQGTAGRPLVNGAFIERNAGKGSDLSARVSRVFRIRGRVDVEAVAEGFNLTNRFKP